MKKILKFLAPILLLINLSANAQVAKYYPTHDSVSKHQLPEWYQDAKFGVIIHYGLYSVSGWAPLFDPVGKLFSNEFFINNPYSEWYMNTMQIKDSPTYKYHLKTYGENFKYDDFVKPFNDALTQWKPDAWSELFAAAGARYVVFVTKHHDGFLLWPSKYRNQAKPDYATTRDVVGELTDSVRKHGMRMGLYYSGGYDWSFSADKTPITDIFSAIKKVPQTKEYADYVDNQWHELFEKYHPDLLWNDIALPAKVNKWKLFADYYNTVPEGVFNNRWGQGALDFSILGQPADVLVDLQLTYDWFDYYSPEYLAQYRLTRHKWEADHGAGYSFGYNRQEFAHPEHFKTVDQLIEDLVDLVSKNGNLLLAVTPEADGTIPELERNLLLGIGNWLDKNGEAIYASKPWIRAEGSASTSAVPVIPVRFTQSKDEKYLYVVLLKNPGLTDVSIHNFSVPVKKIEVLNGKELIAVKWVQMGKDLKIKLSGVEAIQAQHALSLRIKAREERE